MQSEHIVKNDSDQGKGYLFSVIIPVYNAEKYLEETFDSLTTQSIGFENIEVILVNDGSPDNSEKVCKDLQLRYPENVFFISKPNGGASSARNEGMKHIHGRYVNFLDSDDKWNAEAFADALLFLDNHSEIDVVACRYCYFERDEGFNHPLDYKFEKDGIVDIHEKPDHVQLSMPTCFIRAEALEGVSFDERLSVSEDTVPITEIILKKGKYGVLKDAVYFYRKHDDLQSAIDLSRQNKTWYFDTPEYCYKRLFKESEEQYGKVIPYIQYLVMYDLQWRIKRPIPEGVLSDEELQNYRNIIRELLLEIDDSVILQQNSMFFAYKLYALNLKHGEDVIKASVKEGNYLCYNGNKVFPLRAKSRVQLTEVEINNDIMTVKGTTHFGIIEDTFKLLLTDGTNYAAGELKKTPERDTLAFDGSVVLGARSFEYKIKIKRGSNLQFELACPDGDIIVQNIKSAFTEKDCDKYIVKLYKRSLIVEKKGLMSRF